MPLFQQFINLNSNSFICVMVSVTIDRIHQNCHKKNKFDLTKN